LVEVIVSGDSATAIRLLEASPRLARQSLAKGATRENPKQNFFEQIRHYIYSGDTALHVAAAACQVPVVEKLVAMGADVSARNRRGAEPLHYAVDGRIAAAQCKIIAILIRSGADPNAVDKIGVAPLHRAIRNRCADAVTALIDGGADPHAPNRNGSTPMLLATHNTGKSGSGSPEAKAQQEQILGILEERGSS
jgi:hypothetical protein